MEKVVACIIARTVSTRLPLKVLRDLSPGISMIEMIIRRLKNVNSIDEIYICTSKEPVDDIMEDIAFRNNIKIYRGSSDAVIERMLEVGKIENADILIRVTGDNPFVSFEYIDAQIKATRKMNLDYSRVTDVPIGATAEVMTYKALQKCYSQMDPDISEYLMLFIFEPEKFRCGIIKPFDEDFSDWSVTVDTNEDLKRTIKLIDLLDKEVTEILLKDIIELYSSNMYDFPSARFKINGSIRYPFNKTISFDDFIKDMNRRKNTSILIPNNA